MSEIKSMLETVEKVFTAAHTTVEGMQEGQRMQIRDLASAVGLALAMDPKEVLSFVNHFVHNTEIAYVTRGKNGGIRRGTKPAKVVKAAKKSKTADVTEPVQSV